MRDVMRILDATVLTGEDKLDQEIEAACGCDLISDLLAFTRARMLVLTGLVTSQLIRAAEMMDLSGIVFVRGKKPTPEIVAMAAEAGIPVLCTSYPLYESAGLLFEAGLRGKCHWQNAQGAKCECVKSGPERAVRSSQTGHATDGSAAPCCGEEAPVGEATDGTCPPETTDASAAAIAAERCSGTTRAAGGG